MNRNSNSYTIIYASVMVVVVAAALSIAAMKLKAKQDDNIRMEKMQDILRSVGKAADAGSASDKFAYIRGEYDKYIIRSYTVNSAGEITDGDAFSILNNLKSEYEKPASERQLPVFESRDEGGATRNIIPLSGSGLWGAIWGYVSLESDWDTIYGAVFAHAGETPGLGAEIATPPFQDMFKGKTIYNGDRLVAVTVLKGAGASNGNPHAVDAITGGTITSRAVEAMIKGNLESYAAYFSKMRSGTNTVQPGATQDPAIENVNDESHE